jgi:hypothetical protein
MCVRARVGVEPENQIKEGKMLIVLLFKIKI